MRPEHVTRRPSYGKNSPAVGERGARTRQRILDEALQLFEEKGYYETLSDDIAGRVGIVRATLYQYFDGKEAIFRELLEQCAKTLTRLVRRLGPLGPTEQGFDNLHWWLGEWSWLYDRYATVFAQWTQVAQTGELSGDVRRLVDDQGNQIAERLAGSAVSGLDPSSAAHMLTMLVNRVYFYRVGGLLEPLSEEEVIDALAITVQLLLFPETPSSVISNVSLPLVTQTRSDDALPGTAVVQARFTDLGARAQATVTRLIDSACTAFSEHGYHLATVDDVVTTAGVARGTFYKYFTDKIDLLSAVLERGYTELSPILETLDHNDPVPEQVRRLLHDFLPWHRRYAGALRIGLTRLSTDEPVPAFARMLTVRVTGVFEQMLAGVQRDYPFSPRVGAIIMFAVVGRALDGRPRSAKRRSEPTEDTLDFVGAVIERGLLNRRPS